MQKRKINYISHTHWDREWYRSSSEFKVRLYATVKNVIETLEIDQDFLCFTFDGQYQMIEEALEVDNTFEPRLKKLVEEGRVLIGPWYIQPDMNLVDGESIANNLRIGMNTTIEKFGSCMNVLWNPDTFFQSGNTPFFVEQFGFDGVYAWRNFASDNLTDYVFKWQGFDGTEVKAIMFPIGYGYFRYLGNDVDKALTSQIDFIKQIDQAFPHAKNEMLLMGGSDHATIEVDTPKKLEAMNVASDDLEFVQTTPEQYLANCNYDQAPVFKNQPISYKGGRIHPGIGGSRMDIKQMNIHQQHIIAKELSPIVAITSSVGGNDNYKMIDLIWKNLLKNQFHDSIYTSSPEKVNNEIYGRYQLNQQMIDELIYLCSRYIVKNTTIHDPKIDEYLVVFNPLPTSRVTDIEANVKSTNEYIRVLDDEAELAFTYEKRIVDYESKDYSGLKSLAGKYQIDHNSGVEFGEKYEHTITLKNVSLEPMSYKVLKVVKAEKQQVSEQANEKLTTTLKKCINFIKLENILDNGDSYNFSTNEGEQSTNLQLEWKIEDNKVIGRYESDVQTITVFATDYNDGLKLDVKLDSNIENNTLSLVFDFDQKIETATNLHYAHVQNNSFEQYQNLDWKQQQFKEKPLPIYLFSKYLEVNGRWTIISNDVTQFYQNDTQIKFTLLRSYGKMGELDLPYRPGRASGYVLDTPSSQQKKSFEYKFDIKINDLQPKAVNETLVRPIAKFIVPTINDSKMTVPQTKSLIEVDNQHVIFETFKRLRDGKYLIRFSNPTDKTQQVNIKHALKIYKSNLREIEEQQLEGPIIVNKNSATTVIVELV